MFDEFYLRLPFDQLETQSDFFRENSLNPEIYISNQALQKLSATSVRRATKTVAVFPTHTLHAPFIDISPGAHDDEVRTLSFTKMQKVMAIAARWNSRLVVMHYNYDPIYYRHHFPTWVKRAADFYRLLLQPGVAAMIALENVADPTPFVAQHLLETIADPRVIPCLDLGHHHVFARLSLAKWLLYLAPQHHIHFHFHDNDGSEDDHQPLGQGTIDWHRVKMLLNRLQTPFSVGLEPHDREARGRTLAFYRKFFLAN